MLNNFLKKTKLLSQNNLIGLMYIKSFLKFLHVPNSVHYQEKAKQSSRFYSRNSNFYCTDSAVTQSDASAFSLFV